MPPAVEALVADLAGASGVVAVVLGGSRALGRPGANRDWDIGVHYRGAVDLRAVEQRGPVHLPGAWGRLMNGGAWLDLDGVRVDVLLRDRTVVEHWTAEARAGRYEVDGLLGYVAGIPTYSLTAEVAIARVLHGSLDLDASFPPALQQSAPDRWRFDRDFSLSYAEAHARRGNAVGMVGQLSRAVLCEAHARRCARAEWVLNEKHLLDGTGLSDALAPLVMPGASAAAGRTLLDAVDAVRSALIAPR